MNEPLALTLFTDTRKLRKQLATSFLLVTACLYMALSDRASAYQVVIGWAGVTLFGLGTFVLAPGLWRKNPRVRLSASGLEDSTIPFGLIPWEAVRAMKLIEINGVEFLTLTMREPNAWREKLNVAGQAAAYASAATGFDGVNVNLSGVQYDPAELTTFVSRHLTGPLEFDEDAGSS